MATRNDVETAISAIENGGNNTAKEVRHVLNLMLDYIENITNGAEKLLKSAQYYRKKRELDKSTNELLKLIIDYPSSEEANEAKVLLNSAESSINLSEIVDRVLEIIKEKNER